MFEWLRNPLVVAFISLSVFVISYTTINYIKEQNEMKNINPELVKVLSTYSPNVSNPYKTYTFDEVVELINMKSKSPFYNKDIKLLSVVKERNDYVARKVDWYVAEYFDLKLLECTVCDGVDKLKDSEYYVMVKDSILYLIPVHEYSFDTVADFNLMEF